MDKYIKPSKDHPVFKCYNSYFGYIEQEFYKQWEIRDSQRWTIGYTFATSLTDAINRLHVYIKENKESIPLKSKFHIVMMDGTIDKKGYINESKCYSISLAEAKKFKLI